MIIDRKGDTASDKEPGPSDKTIRKMPVVGVGASAGGLDALIGLFQACPVDVGVAFVVIQHLSPDHDSALVTLLRRQTQLPVLEAEEGVCVQPNRIYVIPRSYNMRIEEGALSLEPRSEMNRGAESVDVFFRSLAKDRGADSVGIILSGTGGDGVLGVRAIKEAGGLVIAQEPNEAGFSAMPSNAIASGYGIGSRGYVG